MGIGRERESERIGERGREGGVKDFVSVFFEKEKKNKVEGKKITIRSSSSSLALSFLLFHLANTKNPKLQLPKVRLSRRPSSQAGERDVPRRVLVLAWRMEAGKW